MRAPRFFQFFVVALAVLFVAVSPAKAADTQRASAFIQHLGSQAISILADKSMPEEESARRFRSMLHNDFDLNLLGRFALGANAWRAATPQQRQEYLKLFEELVVDIYSDRFKTY